MIAPRDLPGLPRKLRGTLLAMLALPLPLALLLTLIGGEQKPILGVLLGLGGMALALRALRRGKPRHAAALVGVATGLLAALACNTPVLAALVFGAMAFFGTRLLYEGVAEVPVDEPARPDPWAVPRGRLARLNGESPRLRPASVALGELLLELEQRNDPLPEARRFLTVQLDGLERIAQRLRAGAAPPAELDALVEEMARASAGLRGRLRAEQQDALEIQIKVLSDRLRQEGFA